ncbi:MAG: sulfotransferase [Phycisphaerales bacterium]
MMRAREGTSGDTAEETTEGSNKNPYVFVVGCLRSGTTLLQRMLDHHPQLAVGYDSLFIPQVIKDVAVGIDPPLIPELVERVRGHPRFARLGLPDAAVRGAAAKARTYSEFVCILYSEFGRIHGKPLAGEKSPGYCRHLPRLHALFPWVRTIHLIRDGRDVTLSILQWHKGPVKLRLWQKEPVAACALWWRRDVSTGRRDGGDLGPARYREVTYEELVGQPEEALRDLAAFLKLPFAPEMLAYHKGKTRSKPGRSAKAAWLPPTPGLRDWRTQMAKRDLELFEAIAGDLLSGLGYERAFDTISPEIAAVAEQCGRWWESQMAERRRRAGSGEDPDRRKQAGGA